MKTYEYKTVAPTSDAYVEIADAPEITLDRYGTDGWLLVSFTPHGYIFVREVDKNAPCTACGHKRHDGWCKTATCTCGMEAVPADGTAPKVRALLSDLEKAAVKTTETLDLFTQEETKGRTVGELEKSWATDGKPSVFEGAVPRHIEPEKTEAIKVTTRKCAYCKHPAHGPHACLAAKTCLCDAGYMVELTKDKPTKKGG